MKSLKLTGAIVSVLLTFFGGSAQTGSRSGDFDIRGRVASVNREGSQQNPRLRARILVEAEAGAPPSNDKAVVFITDDTLISEQTGEKRGPAHLDQLRVGQQVAVRFAGPALLSYPVQATAGEIVIMAPASQDGQGASASAETRAQERPDVAAVRRAVEEGNAEWVAAWAKGDAQSVVATFTADGSLLAQGGRVVKGRQLIGYVRDWMQRLGGTARLTVTTTDLWVDGDTAYETGIARYEYRLNNRPETLERRYFTVWKRQRDGAWKIFMDVGVPLNQAAVKSGMAEVNGTKLY